MRHREVLHLSESQAVEIRHGDVCGSLHVHTQHLEVVGGRGSDCQRAQCAARHLEWPQGDERREILEQSRVLGA